MSSSGMSDTENSFQVKGESFAQGNFSTMLLPPIIDIKPPVIKSKEEVVMYSKEVQTATWIREDEDSDEEDEEQVRRRIEEEIRLEMDKLKAEEDRVREELLQKNVVDKDVPCNHSKKSTEADDSDF